jgi:hypothetical protein
MNKCGLTSRDISVDIVTGYGVQFPERARNISLVHIVQTGPGAQPASYSMGAEGSFPGVKRRRREADHLPSPSTENCQE